MIIIIIFTIVMFRLQFWRSPRTCTCAEQPLSMRVGSSQLRTVLMTSEIIIVILIMNHDNDRSCAVMMMVTMMTMRRQMTLEFRGFEALRAFTRHPYIRRA